MTYKGITIEKTHYGYCALSFKYGYLKADTLQGIKNLINKYL